MNGGVHIQPDGGLQHRFHGNRIPTDGQYTLPPNKQDFIYHRNRCQSGWFHENRIATETNVDPATGQMYLPPDQAAWATGPAYSFPPEGGMTYTVR